ncbi:hypothetical protein [Acinetobacter oleivorans]|uniref:hypothetical protein n=1 Tax=Acinetobacter oleivorans TaxID=1148157 RepID=UPI001CD28A39|nr:hypothetical protein [Acinetobacter oleivorans]
MSTEALIELGKKLIEEFGLRDRNDTISKWMLHYLAELFQDYNQNTDLSKKEKLDLEIQAVIFKLWEHRYNLSNTQSYLKDTSSLLLTLKKLNLDSDEALYSSLSSFPPLPDSTDPNDPNYWFNQSLMIDKASKFLIRKFLFVGGQISREKGQEVIALIEKLELYDSFENRFSKFMNDENIKDSDQDRNKKYISQLDQLIDSLNDLRNVLQG